MNCSKGDIAIIVVSRSGDNYGVEVTCLEYVGSLPFSIKINDYWRIDKEIMFTDGVKRRYVPDTCLMPIGKKQQQKAVEKEKPVEV